MRARFATLCLVMALPAEAVAEGPAYDTGLIDQCLHTVDDPRLCVGSGSAACIAGPEGGSTAGQSYCLMEEYAQWEALRADAVEQMTRVQAEIDLDRGRIYPGLPRATDAFAAATTAFEAFRDALCDWEETQYMAGTGTGPAIARCLIEATAAEALRLRGRLGGR